MAKEYELYGREWKDEMMKNRKHRIVDIASQIGKEREIAEYEGILIGLKICKELWAQGQINHEAIYENEVYYRELIKKLKNL